MRSNGGAATHRALRLGAGLAVLIALGVSVAACGSSDDASSGSASTSDAKNSAGYKAAKAYLDKYTANPTKIALPQLPSDPPAAKKVISLLVTPQPVALRVSNAQSAAAKALG